METGIRVIGIDKDNELECEISIVNNDGVEHTGIVWLSKEFVQSMLGLFPKLTCETCATWNYCSLHPQADNIPGNCTCYRKDK